MDTQAMIDAVEPVAGRMVMCLSCYGHGLSRMDCVCHGGGMANTECSPCDGCDANGTIPDPKTAVFRTLLKGVAGSEGEVCRGGHYKESTPVLTCPACGELSDEDPGRIGVVAPLPGLLVRCGGGFFGGMEYLHSWFEAKGKVCPGCTNTDWVRNEWPHHSASGFVGELLTLLEAGGLTCESVLGAHKLADNRDDWMFFIREGNNPPVIEHGATKDAAAQAAIIAFAGTFAEVQDGN